MGTLVLALLILAIIGVLPFYPYSKDWGYGPCSVGIVALIVIAVLMLSGRL